MSWINRFKTVSTLFYSIAVLSLVLAGMWFGASFNSTEAHVKAADTNLGSGTTFPGTNTGAIPDRGIGGCGPPFGPARDVMFNVTGLTGTVSDVNVNLTATHTWVGDVNVSLIAPDSTTHVIFERTGATTATSCGDTSDLANVLYNFDDSATTNWWNTVGGATTPVPTGNYNTAPAGPQASATTAPPTMINPVFNGVSPNGTWILRFTDGGGGDTGSVSAANLTITTASVNTQPANVDRDGDGQSDFSIVRDTSTPLQAGPKSPQRATSREEASQLRREMLDAKTENLGGPPPVGSSQVWYFSNSSNGSAEIVGHGDSINDFVTPEDFDGDGRDDLAVWRGLTDNQPSGNAYFYILNSSTSTLDTIDFGQLGDNPTVTGDYDGDGQADPAVLRCPSTPGQCFYYYLGSTMNANGGPVITFVPWGFGTPSSIFPNSGDFDGDGSYDFCIQRTNPSAAGQGQFVLMRSSDNGVEYINWGANTDLIAPGDYNGDGRSDYAVGRNQGGQRVWYVLSADGSTVIHYGVNFGLSTDFMTPGDYDGDGRQDIAVFRPDVNPLLNFWYVLRSSDSSVQSFEWGDNGDYPLENWRVQ